MSKISLHHAQSGVTELSEKEEGQKAEEDPLRVLKETIDSGYYSRKDVLWGQTV